MYLCEVYFWYGRCCIVDWKGHYCGIYGEATELDIGHEEVIYKRHRHRFEFNNNYRKTVQDVVIIMSGKSVNNKLIKAVRALE